MWQEIGKIFENLMENMDVLFFGLLKILLIFIGGRLLKRILCAAVKRSYNRRAAKNPQSLSAKKYGTITTLTQSVVRYLVDFIMLVMLLEVLGLGGTIGSILATAGIGGVALGLGAQSFLKDFLGGLFMLFDDEYAVGDYIKIPALGLEGTVSAITLRNTSLRLSHGETAMIPHGSIDVVINYTRDRYTLFLDYDIAGEADDDIAAQLILEVIREWLDKNEIADGEASYLGISRIHPFCITLKFMLKLPPLKQWQAERDINRGVRNKLQKNGIELPDYQKGIWVDQNEV